MRYYGLKTKCNFRVVKQWFEISLSCLNSVKSLLIPFSPLKIRGLRQRFKLMIESILWKDEHDR